jgi:tetratricopeptide (TPR) repeat protein
MLLRLLLYVDLLLFCFSGHGQTDRERCRQAIDNGADFLARFRPVESLRECHTAIELSKKIDDDLLLSMSLLGAGQAQWYMGRFSEAIDTINLSIAYIRKAKSARRPGWQLPSALRIISNIYYETGNYEKAFETVSEALVLCYKENDQQNALLSLVQLGSLYRNIGDYATALTYYRQAENMHAREKEYPYRELNLQMGKLYAARAMFDSALYHYYRALPGHPIPRNINLRIGECYILQGKFNTAYQYLASVYKGVLGTGDAAIQVPAMIGLAEIYFRENKTDSALFMAKGALSIAAEKGARQNKRDASLLLSNIYVKQRDSGNALLFYRQYVSLKDSVLSEQFKGQLYSFKRKADDEKQQAQLRLLKWGMFVLVVIGVCVIFVLLLRHNNEKLRLKQRSAELEMQALRAQMNPHFIFNCLSVINHFILDRDTDKASDYLTRFSRLIRLVLVNSEKNTVSLEEELSMLRLYLDMEQLRFKDAFTYSIRYEADVQPSVISVPSFILQPFCENAIWHGLLHKEGKGELLIDIAMKGQVMVCMITDNGIGRKRAAEIKKQAGDNQISFGHKLTTERLALFNNSKNASGSFVIEDIKDAEGNVTGTRVLLQIKNETAND